VIKARRKGTLIGTTGAFIKILLDQLERTQLGPFPYELDPPLGLSIQSQTRIYYSRLKRLERIIRSDEIGKRSYIQNQSKNTRKNNQPTRRQRMKRRANSRRGRRRRLCPRLSGPSDPLPRILLVIIETRVDAIILS
jgi:hypothetical protein